MFIVLTFLRDDDRFNAPEIRSAKVSLNCRENYGDTAIGYVQLKREGDLCIVKCGCKHALAVLMWVHRRSEDPAPTEIACYWKKSRLSKSKQIDYQISRLHIDLQCLRTNDLSLHRLLLKFHLNGGLLSGDFLTFASSEMTQVLCDEAERLTQKQSDCPLWYELRYGRITASRLQLRNCTKQHIVQQTMGRLLNR
ncbi:hypothetical protein ALC62_15720 [Cyphomyrmex costatus]|uniref:SWIM-type domain-containing protein n=1 Tax=Cyphomyrmex costatus TaxID=456900 RepID=A0A151I6J3_9HYME|nr:hypothetical protein ALC62_15720 [Cyphomyrmex costatus]